MKVTKKVEVHFQSATEACRFLAAYIGVTADTPLHERLCASIPNYEDFSRTATLGDGEAAVREAVRVISASRGWT